MPQTALGAGAPQRARFVSGWGGNPSRPRARQLSRRVTTPARGGLAPAQRALPRSLSPPRARSIPGLPSLSASQALGAAAGATLARAFGSFHRPGLPPAPGSRRAAAFCQPGKRQLTRGELAGQVRREPVLGRPIVEVADALSGPLLGLPTRDRDLARGQFPRQVSGQAVPGSPILEYLPSGLPTTTCVSRRRSPGREGRRLSVLRRGSEGRALLADLGLDREAARRRRNRVGPGSGRGPLLWLMAGEARQPRLHPPQHVRPLGRQAVSFFLKLLKGVLDLPGGVKAHRAGRRGLGAQTLEQLGEILGLGIRRRSRRHQLGAGFRSPVSQSAQSAAEPLRRRVALIEVRRLSGLWRVTGLRRRDRPVCLCSRRLPLADGLLEPAGTKQLALARPQVGSRRPRRLLRPRNRRRGGRETKAPSLVGRPGGLRKRLVEPGRGSGLRAGRHGLGHLQPALVAGHPLSGPPHRRRVGSAGHALPGGAQVRRSFGDRMSPPRSVGDSRGKTAGRRAGSATIEGTASGGRAGRRWRLGFLDGDGLGWCDLVLQTLTALKRRRPPQAILP